MAGRMGGQQVTVKGLAIIAVDDAAHTVTIQGVVPGAKGGLLIVSKQA
jgi:ribosomal protein L3